eukprot:1160653-Pelagomonas_calceolata.AAC.23
MVLDQSQSPALCLPACENDFLELGMPSEQSLSRYRPWQACHQAAHWLVQLEKLNAQSARPDINSHT